ncbi:MAG: hypothetical protein CMH53_09465 [Myxococcales bacterium]|nr:hypothetical protein [Myxococcales bacterium]
MAKGIELHRSRDEAVLNRSIFRPRFDNDELEAAWMAERLETFKRVNSRSLIFLAIMSVVFAVLDLAVLNSELSVILTRVGLFVFVSILLVMVRRVNDVRTGDWLFASACIVGLGVTWFQVFLSLPAPQIMDWWLVTLAMLGVVFMVLTEMVLRARLSVAGTLLLFGLVVPFKVNMGWVEAMLGLNHIVIIFVVGWAAAWQVETSRRLAFFRRLELEQERGRTIDLLRNMLPTTIADRLLRSAETIAERHPAVTVLFADIVGFTPWASGRDAEEVVEVLDQIFTAFDKLCDTHGVEKIKTIGDAYMAVGGVPSTVGPTACSVVHLACDMLIAATDITAQRGTPLQLRIGVHEGPAVAGVIGRKKFLYDLWGDTVNTAARVEANGIAGRVQVTKVVAKQLGAEFDVEARGEIEMKGKGSVEAFLVSRIDL